jgi:hypothetical protein
MENVTTKKDKNFKVHNTWVLHSTWNEGGKEKFYNKILKDLKSTLKEGTDLGRVKKSYIDYTDGTACWFCYETKDYTVKVSLYACKNINGGTWFNIGDIEIVNN